MTGIFDLWKRSRNDGSKAVDRLRDAVMEKAREPDLYLQGFVRDTFDGRFTLTALYGGLVMRRLRDADEAGLVLAERLGEALFDRFDYALREQGVGDATIARKARALGESFYGLARAVDRALAGQEHLSAVLQRNGLGGENPDPLAVHVSQVADALDQCDDIDVLQGQLAWV